MIGNETLFYRGIPRGTPRDLGSRPRHPTPDPPASSDMGSRAFPRHPKWDLVVFSWDPRGPIIMHAQKIAGALRGKP